MFNSLKQWRKERGLENTVGSIELNLYEELLEFMGIKDKDEIEYLKDKFDNEFGHLFGKGNIKDKIDALSDLRVFAINGTEAYGYDAEKCMEETLKEIHSRKGAFNPNSGKWEKFKDEESKKQWYKANYKVCKR